MFFWKKKPKRLYYLVKSNWYTKPRRKSSVKRSVGFVKSSSEWLKRIIKKSLGLVIIICAFILVIFALGFSSYFSIKDLDTNEIIIDFDDQFTQLSADEQGNYFTLYMNGLEPERYYNILIKTIIDGSTMIFDDNYYFKVING